MVLGLKIKQKRVKHPVKWLVALLIFAGIACAAYVGIRWFMTGEELPFSIAKTIHVSGPVVDDMEIPTGQIAAYTVSQATAPRYLEIPSIGVAKTRVMGVGITKNNTLDTPTNIHDVAWYYKSAYPGSGYGAVLLSGYAKGMEKPGIFTNLYQLKPGEKIMVERGDGKKITYVVVSNETMTLEQAVPTGMRKMTVSANTDVEGLNVMTYTGHYVPRLGQFDKRVMVRAVIDN